ncbi:SH3 domain-containing protein [Streptomyces sp. NPDC091412]|uniref:SH3 domain-containing protein n=1 Tax=Streptomyces sp. NPDC091412 TaxID=3366002 RepID=UPI0038078697
MATAGPASAAAPCGKAGVLRDGLVLRMKAGVAANMRTGSSTACGITGWADNQDSLKFYCYTGNGEGGPWTYLYNSTDKTYGWVKSSLLPNEGSVYPCGF